MSDEQVALQRGMMILTQAMNGELRAAGIGAEIPDDRRISPRAVIQWLTADGRISKNAESALTPYFLQDTETPRLALVPAQVLVEVSVLETLHKYGALRPFLNLFPGAQVGETGWRSLLGRQAHAVEDRKAAELATEVHAWIADGMRDGLVDIVLDPDPQGLPALLEPDNESHQQLIAEPLRWAARYADTLAARPSWWRLTADFFGSTAPLSAETTPFLAFRGGESEGEVLVKRLRAGSEPHISMPMLLRRLLDPPGEEARRHRALFRLAELGFPDALGRDENSGPFPCIRGYRKCNTGAHPGSTGMDGAGARTLGGRQSTPAARCCLCGSRLPCVLRRAIGQPGGRARPSVPGRSVPCRGGGSAGSSASRARGSPRTMAGD